MSIDILYETIQAIPQNFSSSRDALDINDSKIVFDNVFHDNYLYNAHDFRMLWYGMSCTSMEFERYMHPFNYNNAEIQMFINLIYDKRSYIDSIIERVSRASFRREYTR